ncbi:MAG: diacylglycerol kinase [Tissierellia bacterium]|nr:diacylglycerol kinase [Tissierellia bacterium]
MKRGNFIRTFNFAVQGIISAIRTERNMKFHYLAALAVIIGSLFFNLSRLEFLILFFAVVFVVTAEMFNTAIERTIDLITQDYHPMAKLVKDISAGAVLLSAINALVVAYLLFFDRLNTWSHMALVRIKNSGPHLTFVAVLLVLILTVGLKTFLRDHSRGSYFQGGAVSGHAALAFCLATSAAFISMNGIVAIISFTLALLVAESRVEGGIHELKEAVLGGILGLAVAIILFSWMG